MENRRDERLDNLCREYSTCLSMVISNMLDGTNEGAHKAQSKATNILDLHGDELREYLKPFEAVIHTDRDLLPILPPKIGFYWSMAQSVFRNAT